MLLPLALMIPAVTVEVKLYGLPTANTHSPTLELSELTKERYGKSFWLIFITAKSVSGSVPITSALKERLSDSTTSTISASCTTWLLVTIYPSALMITPEPLLTLGPCSIGPLGPKKN